MASAGKREKDGKTRYEKRLKSKVATSTKQYNKINMNETIPKVTQSPTLFFLAKNNTPQIILTNNYKKPILFLFPYR